MSIINFLSGNPINKREKIDLTDERFEKNCFLQLIKVALKQPDTLMCNRSRYNTGVSYSGRNGSCNLYYSYDPQEVAENINKIERVKDTYSAKDQQIFKQYIDRHSKRS